MTTNVYGIGNALVDYEYLVEDNFLSKHSLPKGGMTLLDESQQKKLMTELSNFKKRQGGGSAANTVIALSQLGGKSFYSCKVAKDDDGIFYMDDLAKQGVSHHLKTDQLSVGTTGKCVVMVTPDGERTMGTFLGVTASYDKNQIDWNCLAASQFLYIEGYLLCNELAAQAAMQANEFARQKKVKVALTFSDPGVVKFFMERFKKLLAQPIDLLFCNEAEGYAFAEETEILPTFDQLKKVAKHVVMTRSSKGAVIWDGQELLEVATKPVKPLDANGAGDMFAGAYMYGLTHGMSARKSAELACHAASAVIQVYGPRLETKTVKNILSLYS